MRDGKWLQPRHASVAVFEKDFPETDLSGLDVYCPGCKQPLKLSRRSPLNQRIGGWCKRCDRGVGP